MAAKASSICIPVINTEIAFIEKKVAELHGNKCKTRIEEEASQLSINGVFNPNGAWALKKKLFPQCSDPPFAVFNSNKNLVTDTNGILDVMKEEFKHRLRNREINPEYEELKELKNYLCQLRLRI